MAKERMLSSRMPSTATPRTTSREASRVPAAEGGIQRRAATSAIGMPTSTMWQKS